MTQTNGMPPALTHSSILRGQKALIVGVANDRSIAWGCAEAMHRSGAEIALTYLNDKARPYVEPLASARRGIAAAATGGTRRGASRCTIRGDCVEVGSPRHSRSLDRVCAAAGAGGAGHRLSARRLSDRDGRLVLVIPRPDAPRRAADDRWGARSSR